MNALIKIQSGLKAPKSQRNTFGNYNYRSCEDILEAVKPLLAENECILLVSDEVMQIADRIYVKATVTLKNKQYIESVSAFAREPEQQKGMNVAQITGSASSYARKYALNGLFAIDDNKDADDNSQHKSFDNKMPKLVNNEQVNELINLIENKNLNGMEVCKAWNIKSLSELQVQTVPSFKDWVSKA